MGASDKIGERIRQLRESRGLSQARLAGISEVDPTQLSRVELGKADPSISWLEKVARGLSVGFMCDFVDVPQAKPDPVERVESRPGKPKEAPRVVLDDEGLWSGAVASYVKKHKLAAGMEARLLAVRHSHLEQVADVQAEVRSAHEALLREDARAPESGGDESERKILTVGTPAYEKAKAELESWGLTVKPRAAITRIPGGYRLGEAVVKRPPESDTRPSRTKPKSKR